MTEVNVASTLKYETTSLNNTKQRIKSYNKMILVYKMMLQYIRYNGYIIVKYKVLQV